MKVTTKADLYWSAFALATAFSCRSVVLFGLIVGRAKFGRRERHVSEYRAGIVFLCRDTLLIGYAVFGGIDEILCGTNDSYYREDTKRDGEISSLLFIIAEIAVDCVCKRFGYIMATATTTAATIAVIVGLVYLGVKNNRINNLNNSYRYVLCSAAKLGNVAKIGCVGIALENAYVALAAVKDNFLFKNCHSLKFLRSSCSHASLEAELDIKLDIYRIKASVESYRLNADISPRYAGILCTNVCCMVDNALSVIGKNYLYVFKAVPVTAGIKDFVCFYTNCFFGRLPLRTARKSIFSHNVLFPPDVIKMSNLLFFNIVCKGTFFDNK